MSRVRVRRKYANAGNYPTTHVVGRVNFPTELIQADWFDANSHMFDNLYKRYYNSITDEYDGKYTVYHISDDDISDKVTRYTSDGYLKGGSCTVELNIDVWKAPKKRYVEVIYSNVPLTSNNDDADDDDDPSLTNMGNAYTVVLGRFDIELLDIPDDSYYTDFTNTTKSGFKDNFYEMPLYGLDDDDVAYWVFNFKTKGPISIKYTTSDGSNDMSEPIISDTLGAVLAKYGDASSSDQDKMDFETYSEDWIVSVTANVNGHKMEWVSADNYSDNKVIDVLNATSDEDGYIKLHNIPLWRNVVNTVEVILKTDTSRINYGITEDNAQLLAFKVTPTYVPSTQQLTVYYDEDEKRKI